MTMATPLLGSASPTLSPRASPPAIFRALPHLTCRAAIPPLLGHGKVRRRVSRSRRAWAGPLGAAAVAAASSSRAGADDRPQAAASCSVEELLQVAKRAAEAGAEVVTASVDNPKGVAFKGSNLDLVTATDKASEAACLAVIEAAFPEHAILGEEGGVAGNTASEYLWVIDPLDGTTNFSRGYPSFAVSVAVLRHGTPLAATVVEFVGGPQAWSTRTFTASRNRGAFCNDIPISVSRVAELSKSLLVTGFGYDHGAAWAENFRLFKHFTDVTLGVRRLGSAAVDLCHVALGISDAYWEFNLKPWDVAAGVLIVEEAGGRVTTMNGCAFSVFDRTLLAANDALWAGVKAETAKSVTRLVEEGQDLSPWFIPEGYRVHTGPRSD